MIGTTLLRIDADYQVRCPICGHFLPKFHGTDEVMCRSCYAVFERS